MRFIFILLTVILSLFCLLTILLFAKKVIPDEQKSEIESVLQKPNPNFSPYLGKTGTCLSADSVKIWYEDIGPRDGETVLLIMGHSFTAMAWPNYLIEPLTKAGYRVIRYDNRGFGLSDRMAGWSREEAYSTRDMASDGVAILDHLGIDKAHIMGVSMGGMIAQDVALDFPERVQTLTVAMSTGELFGKGLSRPSPYFMLNAIRLMAQYRGRFDENTAPFIAVGFYNVLHREQVRDEVKEIALTTRFEYTDRGGWNFDAAPQHTKAMTLRGGRWDELDRLSAPTLIIHGDRDPIFGIDHAAKLEKHITGSQKYIMQDLGHFLPQDRTQEMINLLLPHFTTK